MRARRLVGCIFWLPLFLLNAAPAAAELAIGNSFTYQGQLVRDGVPANGRYAFEFRLYDAAENGNLVGNPNPWAVTLTVSNGLFTTQLNFGPAFNGNERYLEISVQPQDEFGPFTVLQPRQPLTATPYALHAVNAGIATSVSFNYAASTSRAGPASDLSCNGCVDSTDLANGSVTSADIADGAIQTSDLGFIPGDGLYWKLGGNAGAASTVLGTTDNLALNVHVNNARALRLEPNGTSPNLIGGFSGNGVDSGAYGAAIGGGGRDTNTNRVTDHYGTVGGGNGNRAGDADVIPGSAQLATVGGGQNNVAAAVYATICGGNDNQVTESQATIGGGASNLARGPRATIGGGTQNDAGGIETTIGGGSSNTVTGNSSTVGGGEDNSAHGSASTVPGGSDNTAGGNYSFAAGRHAQAQINHPGAFVWADSTDADFSSTAANQFSVRASNGVRLASEAGPDKPINVGDRYRDNAVVAWAKVGSDGTPSQKFGVTTSTRTAVGQYIIGINGTAASAASLIPIAIAEVDAAPNAAADLRIVSVNQRDTHIFDVYINRGTGALVDNDFVFMVTAR